MADEIEVPSTPTVAVHPPTINHLLILTLTTGFVFAYFSPNIADAVNLPSERYVGPTTWKEAIKSWTIGTAILACLVSGVRFFGFAAVVRELVARRSLQWMSLGHWYFLFSGSKFLLLICTQIARQYVLGSEHASFWLLCVQAVDGTAFLLLAGVLLCIAVRLPRWSWRIAAIILAMAELDLALFHADQIAQVADMSGFLQSKHYLGTAGTLHAGLLVMLGLTYLISTGHRQPKMDWLHHLGTVVLVFDSFDFIQAFHRVILQWWSGIYAHLLNWIRAF